MHKNKKLESFSLQNNKWPNMNGEIELRKLSLSARSQNYEI
jgi:hypothetical protein